MSEIPKGWRTSTLGAIAAITSGVAKHQGRTAVSGMREVPYLRVANVQRMALNLDTVKTIFASEDEIEELSLEHGDVLLNEGGDRDKLGRGWVWGGELETCIHQNHVFRARIDPAKALPKFVAYYTNSMEAQKYFLGAAKQTTNLASINMRQLKGLPIPLPPLEEQERIVAAVETDFSRLDAAIVGLRSARQRVHRAKVSILVAAAEGKLATTEAQIAADNVRVAASGADVVREQLAAYRRRWEERKRAGKYQAPEMPDPAKLPALPAGWAWSRIDLAGEVRLGRQRSPKDHSGPTMRPYLRVANVAEDRLDLDDVKEMNFTPDEYEVFKLEHGDVLLNEGQSPHLVGRPAMYRGEVPGACYQNTLIRFRAYSGVLPAFALTVFRAQLHARRYMKLVNITTNIAHLSSGRFAEVEFPVPPLVEQQRIVAEVERRISVLDNAEARLAAHAERLDRARHAILKRAFAGRLVPPLAGQSAPHAA